MAQFIYGLEARWNFLGVIKHCLQERYWNLLLPLAYNLHLIGLWNSHHWSRPSLFTFCIFKLPGLLKECVLLICFSNKQMHLFCSITAGYWNVSFSFLSVVRGTPTSQQDDVAGPSQDDEQPGPSRRKRQPSMSETMPLYTLCKEDLESMDKEVRKNDPLLTFHPPAVSAQTFRKAWNWQRWWGDGKTKDCGYTYQDISIV